VAVLLGVTALLASLVFYWSLRKAEESPFVETPILRAANVAFEQGGEKFSVVVWGRRRLNNSAFDAPEVFQIRIEVSGRGTHVFEWPSDIACAPDHAEIRDVVGNGKNVFVLSCGGETRLVQFSGTEFLFRPAVDRLDSVLSQSRFLDINKDGRLEYQASLNYPQHFGDPQNYRTLPFPVIYRWSPERGFEEVSQEFSEFYRKEVIANLRKLQHEAEEPLRRPLFDSAITYIEQRTSSDGAQKMLPVK
jgi:hypothetical protein